MNAGITQTPAGLNPSHERFLHLVPDDKFIDAAKGVFDEATPGAHDFVCLKRPPFCHLHTFRPIVLEAGEALQLRFLAELPRYAAVFIHYLNDIARLIVMHAPSTTRFIWLGWGADYYHLICDRGALWLPETKNAMHGPLAHAQNRARLLRKFKGYIDFVRRPRTLRPRLQADRDLRKIGPRAQDEPILLNRIMAMSTPLLEDYQAILSAHEGFRPEFIDWNYWTEGFNPLDCPDSPTGCDILLGNSATPENNHLEAMQLLSDVDLGKRHIYCPLSYGDKYYGDMVAREGNARFGERFIPMRGYLPVDEYSRIIQRCSIIVMNHLRQQALGNIVTALCSGANVVLQEHSPVRQAMNRLGVRTYTPQTLPHLIADTLPAIDATNVLHSTRQILDSIFGRPAILGRTASMLGTLRAVACSP